ncbi:alanine/glycine:cation symporter family protein [Desulfotalea psychrophila]|uniref:Probable amino acid carrier protein (AlsT) n=1 Tax=Desulfotalea psychrophila (strain LSv54 / DSM 12343) TaxID=177439 RepID=Q6ANS0_DESPS|nr:alanine/glycine:cation symporter family protein [Desulfotalea psychrophila]CAG36004.1 probable amino acid carrier protein (AlsT) [Desulfotalea psychrophila LSv54]
MFDSFQAVVATVHNFLWGHLLTYVLILAGLYFTFRLGFIQLRLFFHGLKVLRLGRERVEGISSFQVFCTSMAARIGTGNIAGIALAITVGGPGAIFWMWIMAIFGMATSFVESTLAQLYKVRGVEDDVYRGGPAYYMEQGLGRRWMGILFSILLIITYGLAFNSVQANTITDALDHAFGFDRTIVGITVVVITGYIIMGGLKKVARAAEVIVPFMAGLYLLLALVVVVLNIEKIPAVLALIFDSAFGLQAASGGMLGALTVGVSRGLFSNEAGMGSAANVAGSATPNPPHPASQGFVQMIGVFADTFIICTASAAIVLLSGVIDTKTSETGIGLVQLALTNEMGHWSIYFLTFTIILFCYSSIIANYGYAESNVLFLTRSRGAVQALRLSVLAIVMIGSISPFQAVWSLTDISMGLMALVNIIAIFMLSGVAVTVIRDYERQMKAGKLPEFDAGKFPEIHAQLSCNTWKGEE